MLSGDLRPVITPVLQFDPPDRTVLLRWVISGYPPPLPRKRLRRNAGNGLLAATRGRFRCSEMTGLSRRGRRVGVMRRTCLLLRADFFAFRFVSDFRRRQPIATIQEIFTDRSSETKWLLGSKRNALPKRAGKPPEGSRRNLRDTGEKKYQEVRHGQRQKNLRATGRAPVLHAEFPHPFCGSGPADRGVDQAVRFTGPVLFAGRQAGRGVNRRPGMSGLHRRS